MKLKRNELIGAFVICVALVLTLLMASTFKPLESTVPQSGSAITLPASAFTPLSPKPIIILYNESSSSGGGGSSGGGEGSSSEPTSSSSERVKDIRQTIVGELLKGKFEICVLDTHSIVEKYDGYVSTESLMYESKLWHGEVVTRIPQDSATEFVFDIRALIDGVGEVTSISTSVTDVTAQMGENQTKPDASIKIALAEVEVKPTEPTQIPIISDALPTLATIGTWMLTFVVIGVPMFFGGLGLTMLAMRVLYPLAEKVWRKASEKEVKIRK